MRKLSAAITGLIALLATTSADAATFKARQDTHGIWEVRLSGWIEAGDACSLATVLRDNRIRRVVINSAGGSALEGIALGQVIRAAAIATLVPADGIATSAAALAFLGGSPRRSFGPVKLHQPYMPDGVRNTDDASSLALASAEVRFWLQETGIERYANKVFATPHNQTVSIPTGFIDTVDVALRNSFALGTMSRLCHSYVAWSAAP